MEKTTSDGISAKDWGILGDLAADLVNEESHDKWEVIRKKILIYLNRLTKKYGNKASILATKADYVNSILMREKLLLLAYEIIEDTDLKNKTLISSSLAELYIADQKNYTKGQYWLNLLEINLKIHFDKYENMTFEKLRDELQNAH